MDEKKVKIFEYDLCCLLIKLNLPFLCIEPLLNFLKKYSYSISVQGSKLTRHKASDIARNELEGFVTRKIKDQLDKHFFSLIIDEVTDVSKKKFLAVMVQYLDDAEGIVGKLLSLRECSIDAGAEFLFDIIQEEVSSQSYSQNIIGLVSDGAKVMNENSVLAKILEIRPSLWYLHCICHCMHLIASKATKKIPEYVLKLVKNAYKYFSQIKVKKPADFNHTKTMSKNTLKALSATSEEPARSQNLSLRIQNDNDSLNNQIEIENLIKCFNGTMEQLNQCLRKSFRGVREEVNKIENLGDRLSKGLNWTADKVEECDNTLVIHQNALGNLTQATQWLLNKLTDSNSQLSLSIQSALDQSSYLDKWYNRFDDQILNLNLSAKKFEESDQRASSVSDTFHEEIRGLKQWKEEAKQQLEMLLSHDAARMKLASKLGVMDSELKSIKSKAILIEKMSCYP